MIKVSLIYFSCEGHWLENDELHSGELQAVGSSGNSEYGQRTSLLPQMVNISVWLNSISIK